MGVTENEKNLVLCYRWIMRQATPQERQQMETGLKTGQGVGVLYKLGEKYIVPPARVKGVIA